MINFICDRCGKEKCEQLYTCHECGKSICPSCADEQSGNCLECDLIIEISGQMFNVSHELRRLEDKIETLRYARQHKIKHEEKA